MVRREKADFGRSNGPENHTDILHYVWERKRVPPCVQLPNLGLPLRRQKEGKIRDKRDAFADNADKKAQYRGLDVIGYDALLL